MRRTRAALYSAAVRLVSERQSTSVSLTELADEADLSRQAVYSHFPDRDSVLVAAGIDLIEQQLFPDLLDCEGGDWQSMVLLATRHLAHYRSFYRALGAGPCAYQAEKAVVGAVSRMQQEPDGRLMDGLDGDVATFVIGGCFSLFTQWLSADTPPEPDAMTDRLLGLVAQLFGGQLGVQARKSTGS